MAEDPEGIQFDRAEYAGGAAGQPRCAACKTGLAGPVWGAGAALAAYGAFLATAAAPWAAIARSGAWINLFNLMPVRPLDGGRGFSALSTGQRWLVTFTLAGAWAVTHEGLLILLLLAALVRTIGSRGAERPDGRALAEFIALVVGLSALAAIEIPRAS